MKEQQLIKKLDLTRYQNEIDHLSGTKASFEVGVKKLLSYNLPLSVKWLQTVRNGDDLKKYLSDEMNRSFKGYVPAATKARLKNEYFQVAVDCSRELELCASVVGSDYVIIETPEGGLSIDETATKKRIENRCFIYFDQAKVSKGAQLFLDLEKALTKFKTESIQGGFPLPDNGMMFYNQVGTCGFIGWNDIIKQLLNRENMSIEEAEDLSMACYRFNCLTDNPESKKQ